MKKLFIIIFFFSFGFTFGQELNAEALQKEWFLKAEKYLNRNKPWKALMQFDYVDNLSPKTEYKLKASKKIDSLIPILQNKEMKKWIGNWELGQLKTRKFDFEKICITNNSISFFNKSTDTTPSRTEKIKIADYNPKQYASINRVVFDNNEIWQFKVERHKRQDRLFVKLQTDSEGTTYLTINESAMIIDRKERRKAMAEETRTFYNRVR